MHRKVIFGLSEHDASQLLALIKKEIIQDDKVWKPYWKRMAQTVEQAIEHASRVEALRYTSCFNDAPEG